MIKLMSLLKSVFKSAPWSEISGVTMMISDSDQGADLVSVHSHQENRFIAFTLSKRHQRFWIGGQRKSHKSHQWIWSDGSRFGFTKFCHGKPNNIGGNQNCLDIGWTFLFERCTRETWDDQPCNHRLPFICKISKWKEYNEIIFVEFKHFIDFFSSHSFPSKPGQMSKFRREDSQQRRQLQLTDYYWQQTTEQY